jgi:hypothetical protein
VGPGIVARAARDGRPSGRTTAVSRSPHRGGVTKWKSGKRCGYGDRRELCGGSPVVANGRAGGYGSRRVGCNVDGCRSTTNAAKRFHGSSPKIARPTGYLPSSTRDRLNLAADRGVTRHGNHIRNSGHRCDILDVLVHVAIRGDCTPTGCETEPPEPEFNRPAKECLSNGEYSSGAGEASHRGHAVRMALVPPESHGMIAQ